MGSWNDFLSVVKQGGIPDIEFTQKEAAAKTKEPTVNPAGILALAGKKASTVMDYIAQKEREKAADAWFQKQAIVDASQMGGGGMPPGGAPPMPPGGDPMMGGGMPPEMMGGGMPPEMMGGMPPGGAPPMPPMGMDPAMMGGMPPAPPADPAAAVDPALMGPGGKKLKAEEVIVQQCSAIKELLYALFRQLGLEIPISVVSEQAAAAAIIENKKKQQQEQELEDSINPENPRINAIEPLLSQSNKIGSSLEELNLSQERLDAILRMLKDK